MTIYFTGICGTAMGNVALMMRAAGHTVLGSDENVYPPMSDLLRDAGVEIIEGYRRENLEREVDLVVIGNAMSRGNPEVEEVLNRGLRYTSLPELMKEEVIRGRTSVVCTGTHGKTTTSSMTSWVLESAGLSPSFMIGGVPGNFEAGWALRESEHVVLEGDEYDTAFFDKRSKFHHYMPQLLLINNIEFDHADIFDALDDILLSFKRLVNIVPGNGLIVANGDDPNVLDVIANAFTPVVTVGLGEACDLRAVEITYHSEETTFRLMVAGEDAGEITIPLIGEYNVRNALGVIGLARGCGLTIEQIASGLATFRNTRRRLELIVERDGFILYDDFAHHPTAIAGTLRALRLRHPASRLRAIFEPRSNTTRRNIFQSQLADAFADADDVILAQIARLDQLDPTERLDTDQLLADIESHGTTATFLPDAAAIAEHVRSTTEEGDVVVVMSNGGFGGLVGELQQKRERITFDKMVAGRVHRILRKMKRFHLPGDEDTSTVNDGERYLGYYHDPEALSNCKLVISDAALYVQRVDGSKRLPYCAMTSFEYTGMNGEYLQSEEIKKKAAILAVTMFDGSLAHIPVTGHRGRFRDIFEFSRFVMRVIEDCEKRGLREEL